MKTDEGLTNAEIIVVTELERNGFMTSYHPDRRRKFFVGAGSHGGDGNTLKRAIKNCLACCEIWKFWKIDFGKGELALDFCRRLCDEHLGGWKPQQK